MRNTNVEMTDGGTSTSSSTSSNSTNNTNSNYNAALAVYGSSIDLGNLSDAEEDILVQTANTFKNNLNASSISYTSDITMKEDQYIDEVIERARELSKEAKALYDDILSQERSIFTRNWYSYALDYDDSIKHDLYTSKQRNDMYCTDILDDDGVETGGLQAFDNICNFSRLAGAIDELREAIKNFSNGVDVSAAKGVLSYFNSEIVLNNPTSYSAGSNSYVSPTLDTLDNKGVEETGSESIDVQDSLTDDILNSTGDTTDDSIVNMGAASAVADVINGSGVTTSKGLSTASGGVAGALGAGFTAAGIDDIIEADEPIDTLEEVDDSTIFDEVADALESFITPDISGTTVDGKEVKTKSASSIAIPAVAGVGTISAGAIGGKMYMDNKKKKESGEGDDEDDDEDDNGFDDFEFNNENQDSVDDTDNESVVDFKNRITDISL